MIVVCSLRDLPTAAADHSPTHIVSLIQPGAMPATPVLPASASDSPQPRHLKIAMDDITEQLDGYILPSEQHVAELIAFVSNWRRTGPILIHCHAGVSRSMAAALIVLGLDRAGDEVAAGRWLRRRAPHASPNRLIVAHADRQLGRKGRLLEALEAMGPGEPVFERGPVTKVPIEIAP